MQVLLKNNNNKKMKDSNYNYSPRNASPTLLSPMETKQNSSNNSDNSMNSTVIIDECLRLRKMMQPIADKYYYFQYSSSYNSYNNVNNSSQIDGVDCSMLNNTGISNSRAQHRNTALPFVLVLGNHSSGKSSFVNHLLGR